MPSWALGTIRPLLRSIRIAFMSGTCLMSTAMVSGPALAMTSVALLDPAGAGGPARDETRQVRPGIITVAQIGTGLSSRGEAFPKREMDVQRELQAHT